jgi:hypothetical protein
MTLLFKAGAGLVAGMVAGALGLVFLPRPEPNAVKPRTAVEKPQFVVASESPAPTASARAAPAVALAAIADEDKAPHPSPTPSAIEAKIQPAPPPPRGSPPAEAKALPAPPPKAAPAPVSVTKADPPKPAPSPSNSPSVVAEAAPHAPPSPTTRMPEASKPTVAATGASAPWSVRGLVALAKGDLSSARVYLTRAADAGDPRAFVALADTYDPVILAKLGVVCAPGDAQRAKDYLVKAAAAGVVAAKDRMAALDKNAD